MGKKRKKKKLRSHNIRIFVPRADFMKIIIKDSGDKIIYKNAGYLYDKKKMKEIFMDLEFKFNFDFNRLIKEEKGWFNNY